MFPDVILHSTKARDFFKILNETLYILFNQNEVISDSILNYSAWNDRSIVYANAILNQFDDGIVIDIGSGFGTFCIPVALVNPNKFKLYAFEPQRPIFYQLCANLLINNIDNVFAKNEAIGSENKVEDASCLNVATSCNHGSFSLIEELNNKRGIVSDSKESTTFKNIDENYSFDNIRVIKISACGMEYDVLMGAKNTIKNNNNPPMLLEMWSEDFHKETVEKTLSVLKELGYFAYVKCNDYYYLTNEKDVGILQFHVDTGNADGNYKITYF